MAAITLLSDFGTRDAYVAAMKGVICQIAPAAAIVDITHEIEPQAIIQGAFVWRQAVPWFPPGTIHVGVVDPGVGSRRRLLAAKLGGHTVLAPDNGLITLLLQDLPLEDLRVIENRRFMLPRVSNTFHGRDVLAPVAAHLANGVALRDLGANTDRAELLKLPKPATSADFRITGTALYTDRFGNLVTNISRGDLISVVRNRVDVTVSLDGTLVGPIQNAYSDVPIGQPLAIIGSADLLEIAVNSGNAGEHFKPPPGCTIVVG